MLQDKEGKKKLEDNYKVYGMDGTLIQEVKKEGGTIAEYTDILVTTGQSGGRLMLTNGLFNQKRIYGIHAGYIKSSKVCIATVLTESIIKKWIKPKLEAFAKDCKIHAALKAL